MLYLQDAWYDAHEDRNLFVHEYDNTVEEQAVEAIKTTYAPMLFELVAALKKRVQSSTVEGGKISGGQ